MNRRQVWTRKNESGSEISFRKSVIKMSSLSYPLTLWGYIQHLQKLALLNKGELKFEGSPDDMIELAQGKVWEIFVTDPELQQIKEKYPIISTIPSEGGWEIQIVTEKLEGFDGKAIIPNIEHAYVYFMDYLLKDKMDMYSEKIGGDLFN